MADEQQEQQIADALQAAHQLLQEAGDPNAQVQDPNAQAAQDPNAQAQNQDVTSMLARALLQQMAGNAGNTNNNPPPTPPPTAPKMGELITEDGRTFARMGGVPMAGWTGLKSKTSEVTTGQYRSLDWTKGLKRESEIKPLDPKWSKSMPLTDLQEFLSDTLCSNGMEQCMYLTHPHDQNKMINAVKTEPTPSPATTR